MSDREYWRDPHVARAMLRPRRVVHVVWLDLVPGSRTKLGFVSLCRGHVVWRAYRKPVETVTCGACLAALASRLLADER